MMGNGQMKWIAFFAGAMLAAGPIAASSDKGLPEDAVIAVIEIPAESDVKYERDAEGRIFVDRFLTLPVRYPVNYGVVPGTLAGDGDELDILVITRRPIIPGARIAVRPIGVLHIADAGDADDKIVAVPAAGVDPAYDTIRTVADLPAAERDRITAFFRLYKQDGEGRSPIVIGGFAEVAEARAVIDAASQAGAAANR